MSEKDEREKKKRFRFFLCTIIKSETSKVHSKHIIEE